MRLVDGMSLNWVTNDPIMFGEQPRLDDDMHEGDGRGQMGERTCMSSQAHFYGDGHTAGNGGGGGNSTRSYGDLVFGIDHCLLLMADWWRWE